MNQALQALAIGNERRLANAEAKRKLTSRAAAVRLLRYERESIAWMKVFQFADAVPWFTDARLRWVCRKQDIWPLVPIGTLSERQVLALIFELTPKVKDQREVRMMNTLRFMVAYGEPLTSLEIKAKHQDGSVSLSSRMAALKGRGFIRSQGMATFDSNVWVVTDEGRAACSG